MKTIKSDFREEVKPIITSFLENGFTIKQESAHLYRVWNSRHKYYLINYSHSDVNGPVWSIGETSNYREGQFDISRPKPIEI